MPALEEPTVPVGRFTIIKTDPSEPGIIVVPIGSNGETVEFRDMGLVRSEVRFWDVVCCAANRWAIRRGTGSLIRS